MTLLSSTFTSIQYGGLTFGSVDSDGVSWRIIKDGFQGWGSPSSSINPVRKTRQRGAWAGDAFATERYMTLTLMVVAPSPGLLNQALENLHTAVSEDTQPMVVSEAGFVRTVNVRRAATVVDDGKISSVMAQPTFQVVAVDPRKFWPQLSGVTKLPMTSGGLTVPFTSPFPISTTVVSGQVSLFNPGNETGPVRLRIDGPCTGPVITHVSTGAQLVFSSSLVLALGEWLDVDMEAHTVLANGQSSRAGWITGRGWSGFDPGSNTWSFTSASYDPASQLTVYATPASQ